MDYQITKATRRCATSGRELAEGEVFYSALVSEGNEVRRYDYGADAWAGAPEGVVGWWKSQVPTREAKKAKVAPSEILLELFEQLEHQPLRADMRYVLALLMVRRRILRLEESTEGEGGALTLHNPRDERTHHVAAVVPDDARTLQIQEELATLLLPPAT